MALYLFIATVSFPLLSLDWESLNPNQEECFATSMIGYDYVINSRAGLPIERALNTVSVDETSESIRDSYKYALKTVVKNAYRWKGTPHTYAINVLYSCAFSHGKMSNNGNK